MDNHKGKGNEVSPFRYGVQSYVNQLLDEIKRLEGIIIKLRGNNEKESKEV